LKRVEVAIMYESDEVGAYENPTVAPKSNGESQTGLDPTTGGNRGKRMHAIPRSGSLESLTEINPSLDGVELKTLAPFDTICVRTRNSNYRIFLLEPTKGWALVEGGRRFVEPVEATVSGSTFGGSMLKMGWIGMGLRMEIYSNGKRILTSPVQSFRVEPQTSAELVSSMCH
jgi:hypothetical protein